MIGLAASSVGAGSVILRGETGNPGAVIVRVDASVPNNSLGGVVAAWNGAYLRVANLHVERTGGPNFTGFESRFGGHILVEPGSEVRIGTTATAAIRLIGGNFTGADVTLRHVGNAARFIQCAGGNANLNASTIDVDGRNYSAGAMLQATRAGIITNASGAMQFIGTATGPKVQIQSNGVIDFGSRTLAQLPGTSVGVIDTGGVYLPGYGGEIGSNANGQYIRFADGTQICTISGFETSASTSTVWIFPAAFVFPSNPQRLVVSGMASGAPIEAAVLINGGIASGTSVAIDAVSGGSRVARSCGLMAVGRWY